MVKTMTQYATEWESNAQADAMWVILTDSKYYGGKWDRDEFFATGEEEIKRVFDYMHENGISVPNGVFLDFGCGVGRLSKALRARFEGGYGIDISEKMVEYARSFVSGVNFMANKENNLRVIPSDAVDFIYSNIVLQHIPNSFQMDYISEFFRILKPGGLAVFQIPLEIINPLVIKPPFSLRAKKVIKKMLPFLITIKRKLNPQAKPHHEFRYEMNPLSDGRIRQLCGANNCVVETTPATNSCEPDHNGRLEFYGMADHRKNLERSGRDNVYLSCMYFIRKPL